MFRSVAVNSAINFQIRPWQGVENYGGKMPYFDCLSFNHFDSLLELFLSIVWVKFIENLFYLYRFKLN